MKICVLGGCGAMAKVAVELLNKEDEVEKITIADIDIEKAKSFSQIIGKKATAVKVDARNHQNLIDVVKGYNVALGFIGPFYIFEKKIADACIDAGVNYVSISDDYDAYLDVITFDKKAKERNVTVITSLGNSPGVTNILAKKGYLSMNNPRKINISWSGGSGEEVGKANVKHVMHIFAGTTLQYISGKQVRVRCGDARKITDFPLPMGKLPVYYTGHAESVSIPMNLKGLEEVTLHGGIHPPYIPKLAIFFARLGLTTSPKKRDIMAKIITPFLGLFEKGGVDKSVFRIDVYGTHQGREKYNYYTGVGPIAFITSLPCVVGALMLAKGEVRGPGVFAPEAIFEPDEILEKLKAKGMELNYYEN